MKTKRNWRKGLGISQIMATLLIVLPTLAFSITFLLEYWAIMQSDYQLKLVANITSDYADSKVDLRDFSDAGDLITAASKLCPGSTTFQNDGAAPITDNDKGLISITISYVYDGTYFKNKKISTTMQTYSLHDQNMTYTAICK